MGKLLRAALPRVIKSRVFWVCTAGVSLAVLYVLIQNHSYNVRYDTAFPLDRMFFGYNLLVPIQCAVFCSLFLGTEYAEGVIRNKLVVGHTRTAVYLANLITVLIASSLMSLACLAVCAALGVPLFGGLKMSLGAAAAILAGSFFMTLATCSVCTLGAMTVHKRAVLAILLVLGAVGLLMIAAYLQDALEAPEYLPYAMGMSVDGELVMMDDVPNPRYLTGAARQVCQFLYDFLPTGQALQYRLGQAAHLWLMCLYSAVITAVTTIAGLAAFRRKDIK